MFYYAIILYNNKIKNLYFKCECDPSASLLPFHITVALPDGGRNYRPKHVVMKVMNKWIHSLINKVNLVYNLFALCLFLVYLSISTSFGRLCAHHQEKLCLCDTSYLLFCLDDCLVCMSMCSCIQDSQPHRITTMKCRINTVSPDDEHTVAWNMSRLINILRINILRINCAPSWLYLRNYRGMHGQQNIEYTVICSVVFIRKSINRH